MTVTDDRRPDEGAARRVGFVVNPIAGMGGRVALKGTDGMADRAARLGAAPVAPQRATRMLRSLQRLLSDRPNPLLVSWTSCSGRMGEDYLREAGFESIEICWQTPSETSASDTVSAVEEMVARGVEVVLFGGGDGTARDVCGPAGALPILGIPCGVKMWSGVFAVNPEAAADLLVAFLEDRAEVAEVDVFDVDEEKARRNELSMRLVAIAHTPFRVGLTQSGKDVLAAGTDADAKQDIAEFVTELMAQQPRCLFLLGAGSTVAAIARHLGLDHTLLGVDAVRGGRMVEMDLDEAGLLALLSRDGERRLVLSPIGAQGFVLGRGNQQLSPAVVAQIGRDGLLVVATPAKLERTPVLRFDTGDASLDRRLAGDGYLPVVVGYRTRRLVKVEA